MARVSAAATSPLRAAFNTRVLTAVAEVAEGCTDEALGEVLSAPTDFASLLVALQQPGVLERFRRQDPLFPARIRGLQARQELLNAEGGVSTVAEVANRLGISRQAVDKRRRAGTLLALDTGRRGYLYPVWQFGDQGPLFGLPGILGDLRDRDPWARMGFFLTGDHRLGGRTPLAALRAGEVAAVRRAARSYGEHGAA
ncbi:MAG: hypothetical protein EXR72_16585 [Myxococcales bacterium]|nr:hypothetical protein [Myxococcales bacterium]